MSLLAPNVYDVNCPTRQVLDLIADKWSTLIVGLLANQTLRFTELQRHIGGISQKMLTQTLRNLERDGLVQRIVYAQVPPRVEYALTPLGQTLRASIAAIIKWSENHIEDVIAARQSYDRRIGV